MKPNEMNPPPALTRVRQLAPLLLVLLSAAAAVGAYLQALNYPFISDDEMYVTSNTKLAGLHLTELWRLFVEPYNGFSEFLPLRDLSYWFDMTLFGMNPSAFRVHNILLYLLCLPLVYATTLSIWRYFRPADAASAPWAAATVTALFALHPALVEPVVWISGRKYMLPNLFSMLALWLAVNAKREHGLSAPHAAAALAAFAAAMLSKPSYVTVAPLVAMLWVIFWLDIPAPDRRRSQLLWPLAILFLAAFLFLIFIAVSGTVDRGVTGITAYFGIEAVARTLAILGWLVRLAVSPESRHFFYPMFEDPSIPAMVSLGGAVLAAAATGAVMILRKRSLEGFAWVAFFLLCMPYMQLIPFLSPSFVQDRYLSLAAWPVMLLIVALSWRLNPVPRTALLLAIALPWGFQTAERPRDWRNIEVLVETDLRAYPGYYMPVLYRIESFYLERGLYRDAWEAANTLKDPDIRNLIIEIVRASHAVNVKAVSTGDPQEAMARLWNAGLKLDQPLPAQAKWNTPMNGIWSQSKRTLRNEWGRLIDHFPDNAPVRYNAGLWLMNMRYYKDAVAQLRTAVESQRLPESVRGTAFKNLGLALINSGHIGEAEAPLRAALEQSQPDIRAYCVLSEVYKQAKRLDEAAYAEAKCPKHAPNDETAQ